MLSFTAYCTFIRPLTPMAFARAFVWRRSSLTVWSVSECGGKEQALSPECTPASSICSMMPEIQTSSPSQTASTSTSEASDR